MAVTLTKKQVNEIVKSLGQVMSRKMKVPVLGYVLFEPGEDGRVQVTATDLEQTLTMRLASEKLEGAVGRFLFPVAELKALKSMPNVVLLPHVGSATIETRGAMGGLVVDNLISHLDSGRVLTPVPETAHLNP